MNLPNTIIACHELIKKLDRELIELKTEKESRGAAAALLRTPIYFKVIDDVLESVSGRPFTMSEIFEKWLDLTDLSYETQKIRSDLRKHFHSLLKLNGFIHVSGGAGRGALWRISYGYNFVLRQCNSLKWRKLGQVEGTYLVPSTEVEA